MIPDAEARQRETIQLEDKLIETSITYTISITRPQHKSQLLNSGMGKVQNWVLTWLKLQKNPNQADVTFGKP